MSYEGFGSCYINIGGERYANFTNLTVKRDKKEMSASGTIVLSWPGAEQFNDQNPPAQEMIDGAKGEIYLDNQKVATVRIDSRTSHGSPTGFKLELSFRGLTSALVDSSATHPSGQENKKKPKQIVKKLMEGYEPKLVDKSTKSRTTWGLTAESDAAQAAAFAAEIEAFAEGGGGGGGDDEGKELERFIIHEGETVERAIRRCTREYGINVVEDEDGNLVMEDADADEGEGQDFELGRDFVEWTVKRDIAPRYSKVVAKGNAIPTDEKYGRDAEEMAGEAIDNYVEFKRVLHILVDSDQDHESLKERAVAEANRRKGKGLDVSLTMSTWSDQGGKLWKPGTLHHVVIPVDQVDDDLKLSAVTFNLDKDKRRATLTLVPPETFTKETEDKKKDKGGKKGGRKGKRGKGKARRGSKKGSKAASKKPFARSVKARPATGPSRTTYGLTD